MVLVVWPSLSSSHEVGRAVDEDLKAVNDDCHFLAEWLNEALRHSFLKLFTIRPVNQKTETDVQCGEPLPQETGNRTFRQPNLKSKLVQPRVQPQLCQGNAKLLEWRELTATMMWHHARCHEHKHRFQHGSTREASVKSNILILS